MEKITDEEFLMYNVMKAIYESGIPIEFKGAMVLKACLLEAGFSDDIRHTVDIDANWHCETDLTPESMTRSLQEALHENGIELIVKMYRMFGNGRSAGFELKDPYTEEILFTMDIDVNRLSQPTQIYEISGMRFCGVSPIQMLADKVAVVSTDKVFRRIKDVVDLYYLSHFYELDEPALVKNLLSTGRTLGDFHGFLYRVPDLQHAYEKFRFLGGVEKPAFDEIYMSVKRYLEDILPLDRETDIGFIR